LKIHFIGIGGIGISGLAKYMLALGHTVSGSDMRQTTITDELVSLGCAINIGHRAEAIKEPDMVVYSAVVKPTNVERVTAEAKGIKTLSRKAFLPYVLSDREVYAVCGAHGKSTTTAILASIMSGSAIIGAQSKAMDSNMRFDATNRRMIFEADESDGSFLEANAAVAIVTNAEPEHMEYYGHDEAKFYGAYRAFLDNAPLRIINAEDPFLATYEGEAVRLYPSRDIRDMSNVLIDDEPYTRFALRDLGYFEVWGLGEHIVTDAALAILAALEGGMALESIRASLKNYHGIKKRFDIIHKNRTILIDDYAHHPTEIAATFKSIMTYARLKGIDTITTIWQPHKYSRTIDNIEAFSRCFDGTQRLIILPVYSAGEEHVAIDFETIFASYAPLFVDRMVREGEALALYKNDQIVSRLDKGIIIGFGAGDITYQLRG